MNAVIILSAVMAVLGCLGLWLAGRGGWSGWAINLAAQPAWAAFSVATHAWPLLASCVAYTIVFTGNWHRAWVRAGHRPLRLLTFRHRIKIVDPAPYLPKQNHYYRRPQQVGPFCQAIPPVAEQRRIVELDNVVAISRCYEPAGHAARSRVAAHHCLVIRKDGTAVAQTAWQWMDNPPMQVREVVL